MNQEEKFATAIKPLKDTLPQGDMGFLQDLFEKYRLTFQQTKKISEALVELRDWKQDLYKNWYLPSEPFASRDQLWKSFCTFYESTKTQPPNYSPISERPLPKQHFEITNSTLTSAPFTLCPTESSDWLCCGLHNINLVENCNLGCSYCALQDLYPEKTIQIADNILERLNSIHLEPNQFYRITTGEYSDSLLWGNRNGLLEHLSGFAKTHPNTLLELKTKSINTSWLMENSHRIPRNLMVSWSLNPQVVIDNEEAATPSLNARLRAARQVADLNIKIGFHFHPLLNFDRAIQEYEALGKQMAVSFQPHEIAFVSFGTLSFTKSQLKTVRQKVRHTQLLKTAFVPTGDQKWTYPEPIRLALYRAILTGMKDWIETIPHYLCMEPLTLWQRVFPALTHQTTAEFSTDFNQRCFARL